MEYIFRYHVGDFRVHIVEGEIGKIEKKWEKSGEEIFLVGVWLEGGNTLGSKYFLLFNCAFYF